MTADEQRAFIDTITTAAVRHGMGELGSDLSPLQRGRVEHAMTSAVKRAVALVAAEIVVPTVQD